MIVTLASRIRDAVARSPSPDPHVVARKLLSKLSAEERDTLALSGLVERCSLATRAIRSAARDEGGGTTVGRSRWQRHVSELDTSHFVAGEWVLLGDCGAEQLDALAAQHAETASQHAALRDRFAAYAQQVRTAGVARLRDLSDLAVAA